MARLTQQSSAPPPNAVVNTPQSTSTQSIASAVQNVVAPKVNSTRRRYPRWFFPVLTVAAFLTGAEFGQKVTAQVKEFAMNSGWKTRQQHSLTLPGINFTYYAVAPKGDLYLAGYYRGQVAYLDLYKKSGELLWSVRLPSLGTPVFSQDSTQIFSGADVLDAKNGQVIAHAPIPESGANIAWASGGSRAVWKQGSSFQIWDRATKTIRTIALESGTNSSSELRLSPDGKWLATAVYLKGYKTNVVVWDLTKPTKPRLFSVGHGSGESFGLAFSPDSQKLLYTGKEYAIAGAQSRNWAIIWFLNTQGSIYNFAPEHLASIAAWSPDSKHVALRGSDNWSVYNAYTGDRLWYANHHTDHVFNALYFTQDGRLYYYDHIQSQGTLEYWDLSKAISN